MNEIKLQKNSHNYKRIDKFSKSDKKALTFRDFY